MDPKQLSIKTWKLLGSMDERIARIETMLMEITTAPSPEPESAKPEPATTKGVKNG